MESFITLVLFSVLGIIITYVVDGLKAPLEGLGFDKIAKVVGLLFPMIVAMVIAFNINTNIFKALDIEFLNESIAQVITGLILSLGSNKIHDFISDVISAQNKDKVD